MACARQEGPGLRGKACERGLGLLRGKGLRGKGLRGKGLRGKGLRGKGLLCEQQRASLPGSSLSRPRIYYWDQPPSAPSVAAARRRRGGAAAEIMRS